MANQHSVKHGHSTKGKETPTYRSWQSMKSRCSDVPSSLKYYQRYAGIKYCERWESFENFLADMGERPCGTTLDRIDVNGDYTPENCRWATLEEQQNNRKNSAKISYNGETLGVRQWARRYGLSQATLYRRLKNGWSVEDALLSMPHRGKPYKTSAAIDAARKEST